MREAHDVKRSRVLARLALPDAPSLSARALARELAVSQPLVSKLRRAAGVAVAAPVRETEEDGMRDVEIADPIAEAETDGPEEVVTLGMRRTQLLREAAELDTAMAATAAAIIEGRQSEADLVALQARRRGLEDDLVRVSLLQRAEDARARAEQDDTYWQAVEAYAQACAEAKGVAEEMDGHLQALARLKPRMAVLLDTSPLRRVAYQTGHRGVFELLTGGVSSHRAVELALASRLADLETLTTYTLDVNVTHRPHEPTSLAAWTRDHARTTLTATGRKDDDHE
jgi:hypothetical protein